jgi:hypothetical protein
MGYITAGDLEALAAAIGDNAYSRYLKDVLRDPV